MPEKTTPAKKSYTADWLVRGTLSRLGDIFDRLTGRGAKPVGSLATSGLIERLKRLLDSQVRDLGDKGKFIPHNIKLKMQWDKFSTDSDESLDKLREELLIAILDHVNDNHYYTYAPIQLEVKPDYFTEGVKFFSSFDTVGNETDEAELNVTVTGLKVSDLIPPQEIEIGPSTFAAHYEIGGEQKSKNFEFAKNSRISVGRTIENGLTLPDASVSKIHAVLIVNAEGRLVVSDTGSTNGTFVNDERIAYGKGVELDENAKVRFGLVEVRFEEIEK